MKAPEWSSVKRMSQRLLVLVAMLAGGVLLLSLPIGIFFLLSFFFRELEVALVVPGFALYLLLFCLPVGLVQWQRHAAGQPSSPLRLPSVAWLGFGAALAILLGQAALLARQTVLFWPFFVLAAALPPLTALALASQRLAGVTTWRRALAGLLSGSLLSTHATILLGAGVTFLAYLLVLPLRELTAHLLASRSLERLFFSPALALALIQAALVAPLVEELTKPLAAMLLARRLRSPAEAFLVGMAGGVGFAILENMLYEAAGARLWAHIALLRGIGGALHPLNAGLVALGWYGVLHHQPGAWRRWFAFYGLAVGLHALWNGGLTLLLSAFGTYFFGAETWQLDIYGVGQPGVVFVFMLLEAIVLWRLLLVVTARLPDPAAPPVETALALHLEQPRRLALWATALLVLLVPIGALYGPLLTRYGNKLLP